MIETIQQEKKMNEGIEISLERTTVSFENRWRFKPGAGVTFGGYSATT